MFSTKKAVALSAATAILVSLAACGGSDDSGNSASKDGKLSGSITFQTWNLKNDKYTPYFNDLIKQFEKENPGTTIKWIDQPSDGYEQKLSADAAAGQLPDIVDAGASMMYMLAKAGILMDVSKEAPKAAKNYTPGGWKAATFSGNGVEKGVYAFPWYVNDGPQYYNTEVLKKCGVSTDKLPKTWDEYFDAANTLTDNCKGDYMSTMMANDMGDLASAGIKIINDDHTKYVFNSPKAVAFLQRFVDLYKKGGIPPEALDAKWSQQSDFFQRGTIASMGGSAYSADGFKLNAPDLYKNLAVGPKINDTPHSVTVGYEMLGVNATTKNKPLALAFAQYVTNSKNQLEFDKKAAVFPSSAGTIDDPYFAEAASEDSVKGQALKITLDAVKNGSASRPAEFTDSNGNDYYGEQVAMALQGKQTAKQALDKAVAFANKKLQQK
ncbi:ABC transporter substrate-binding protein [Bifidobacterium aemilianum]|uniref:ABC transporter substrate-binding protein n=1 Tax=Bifidobacterium aemilianum TaxID=2493120 RepID=A0A366KBB7_9BIFI|nr:sugar ABC transporter substrate-binding protein [Bifidobacterium aemilianum]RBP98542.1 ABC transporter substrate-binding protein [Bifidobacterium aemilianum]